MWKTSVTCTTICSQIDRGIPFSVYPSSAPHPGRYIELTTRNVGHTFRERHGSVAMLCWRGAALPCFSGAFLLLLEGEGSRGGEGKDRGAGMKGSRSVLSARARNELTTRNVGHTFSSMQVSHLLYIDYRKMEGCCLKNNNTQKAKITVKERQNRRRPHCKIRYTSNSL